MDGVRPSGKHTRTYASESDGEPSPPNKRLVASPSPLEENHPRKTPLADKKVSHSDQNSPKLSRPDSVDSDYGSELSSISSTSLSDFSDMDMDTHDSPASPVFHRLSISPSLQSKVMLQETDTAKLQQLYLLGNEDHDDNIITGVNSLRIIYQDGAPLYIFKPGQGETGVDRLGREICSGITPGTYYLREVVPELFNTNNFFPIPATYIAELGGEFGSCQSFISETHSLGRMAIRNQDMSHIDKEDLARLVLLDIIIGNLDRHLDNILIKGDRAYGIDHGLCMSSNPIDPLKIVIPKSWQYMESLSDESLNYCRKLHFTDFESIKCDLEDLGIEEEAITCCRSRITLLNEIITIADRNQIKLNISEIAELSAMFSNQTMSENMLKQISPKIEELVKIKGQIKQIMTSGTRANKLKLRHRSQLSPNIFAQEKIATTMGVPLEEAGKIWEKLFLPTIKYISEQGTI